MLGEPSRVRSVGDGYVLVVRPKELDADLFVEAARMAAEAKQRGDLELALSLYDQALGYWRGSRAFAEFEDVTVIQPVAQRLAESRLLAIEDRMDVALRLGRHAGLIADLAEHVAENPFRERLVARLMLAYHQCGRQVEALSLYARTRSLLRTELGIEPGRELQELHQAILRDDIRLDENVPAWRPIPDELPPAPRAFTGRTSEVQRVVAWATGPRDTAEVVMVSAIDGLAGIGKTALATHVAYQVRDHFPDGKIFVDLLGFTEGVAPAEPAAVLERLLRSAGVPAEGIPAGLEERVALWRSMLADRRMLVILDNVRDEAQVRPLLPGAGRSLVLITSRRRLSGLDDVRSVHLDVLPVEDAVALFRRIVGENRMADAPPDLVRDIVEACGRLPLAIRMAAAKWRDGPADDGLSELLSRLRDENRMWEELEVGDRSVTSALQMSYDALPHSERRTSPCWACILGPISMHTPLQHWSIAR